MMSLRRILVLGAVFFVLLPMWWPIARRASAENPPTSQPTLNDVNRWIQELSNWGRWGDDDELGAVNLITPAKRLQAARLVTEGVTISLAHDVEKETAPDNPSPFEHVMLATGTEPPGSLFCGDQFRIAYHGYAHSHIDAVCHMFHGDKMFNGFSRREVTSAGAAKLSIHNFKNGIVSRAVLFDMPRLRGVDYLEPSTAIYPDWLDAWEKRAGLQVESGDIVLIYTGRWARRKQQGPWDVGAGAAGLHVTCAPWLKKRDAAVLGSDAASDVLPSGIDGITHPVHQLVLVAMGMPILDNLDLEAAAKKCAELGRWEFQLTVAPLAVRGATGSPANPIAAF